MCIDFTDFNKTCLKDCFLLLRIVDLVDSANENEVLCFLDVFKGYHQISMSHEDQEKTASIMDKEVYCYTIVPFGLKNVWATYQRLVNKIFHKQLGMCMEAIDDLQTKNRAVEDFISDLKEVFEVLRDGPMMLNSKKCVFEVRSEKFLGYTVSQR